MWTKLLVPSVLVLGGCAHGPATQHGHANQRFDSPEAWAERFDDPRRDEWQKPDEVLGALQLRSDARVADLGAATGYFAVRLAAAVPRGRVYGVDVESSMVEYLSKRAGREGLSNLSAVLATGADAALPEAVDLVLVVDTYHHLVARTAYFQTLRASVKPGGRLAIIDFTKASRLGPPAAAKVDEAEVRREVEAAGWSLVARHDWLPEQFFLVFARL